MVGTAWFVSRGDEGRHLYFLFFFDVFIFDRILGTDMDGKWSAAWDEDALQRLRSAWEVDFEGTNVNSRTTSWIRVLRRLDRGHQRTMDTYPTEKYQRLTGMLSSFCD